MKVLYSVDSVMLKCLKSFYISSGIILCMCACSTGSGKQNVMTEQKKEVIRPKHFWDEYDFTDTMMLNRPEAIETKLVEYLSHLPYLTNQQACENIRKLVVKTRANSVINRWFLKRLEHYLYEPDSPLQNDDYYISVLEEMLSSDCLSGMMRVRPSYQLEMLRKNRVGTKATNFTFTLTTGKIGNLWDIPAERTLLLFYDPNCEHCRDVIRELSKSEVINTFLSHSKQPIPKFSVVAVCLESNMNTWKKQQLSLPSTWVRGCDAENVLTDKKLYLLRSIPSMYLLGEDKQVLLKEATVDEILTYLLKNDSI